MTAAVQCPCCEGRGSITLQGTPGERIRQLMDATGVTTRMLAAHIDRSPAAVSLMVNGKLRVLDENIAKIAELFGVPESALR